MYIAALNKVVQKYPAELHGYADDHNNAFRIQAGNAEKTYVLQQLNDCLNDTIMWMTKFKLKMNNSKTEIIMYGTKYQLAKLNISCVSVRECEVKCVNHVSDLGVYMDSTINFDNRIRKKCQIAFAQLRNLKDICKHLSQI
jgi:hypothetical protein